MPRTSFPKERTKQGERGTVKLLSPLFEIAFVLVRLDHIAGGIVNTNHSML